MQDTFMTLPVRNVRKEKISNMLQLRIFGPLLIYATASKVQATENKKFCRRSWRIWNNKQHEAQRIIENYVIAPQPA